MKKSKTYPRTFLDAQAYESLIKAYCNIIRDDTDISIGSLTVKNGNTEWEYDSYAEFLSELRNEYNSIYILLNNSKGLMLTVQSSMYSKSDIRTSIEIGSPDRELIIRMGNEADQICDLCVIPEPESSAVEKPEIKPTIFIGHGGSPYWRDLKDHLQDHHKYEVVAYETGARAGHTIRDVISDMLNQSSFAILVMTAEDEMPSGSWRARQNVIHEIGLFQGRLGFTKAIVLKEDGTEEFSNINGVQQIRFSKGNIKETFGDVLAVIKREFE
jgi:predicted nucleotide-binding protein